MAVMQQLITTETKFLHWALWLAINWKEHLLIESFFRVAFAMNRFGLLTSVWWNQLCC